MTVPETRSLPALHYWRLQTPTGPVFSVALVKPVVHFMRGQLQEELSGRASGHDTKEGSMKN